MPLLVHNTHQHSGVIYQITCESERRRRRGVQEVLAAGGRYDKMLASFRQGVEPTTPNKQDGKHYGAGISISLDKVISAFNYETSDQSPDGKFGIDVAVCCIDGVSKCEEEIAGVLRDLWALGLRVTSLELSTNKDVYEYCHENLIPHIIILKSSEKESLRVFSWERDRFQERNINCSELMEYMQRQTDIALPALNRSDSKISTNIDASVSSNNPVNVNINFVLSERDKISGSGRRSFKNTMLAQMNSCLQRISSKVPIEIFAVFLEMSVLQTIAISLEIDKKAQDFEKSIILIIEK